LPQWDVTFTVDAEFSFSASSKGDPKPEKARMIKKADDISRDLLAAPPRVINIGLEIFATELARQDIPVAHVRWSPPAGGNSHLAGLLEKLQGK
jgi:hypothetical protein